MARKRFFSLGIGIVAFAVGMGIGAASMFRHAKTPENAPANPTNVSGSGLLKSVGWTAIEGTGVFINDRQITLEQVAQLRRLYGMAPPPGRYWYDSRSGLYGYWGYEAAGYILPGHAFGPVAAQASRGNTGIFLNGRQINLTEALFFKRLFGAVYQGRFWLDGKTGNLGIEGNSIPLVNLVAAMQQAQRSNGNGSEYHWRDGSGAVVGGQGNCTFAAIPGAPVYATPGCD